jgi:acyl-CoA hydrolase
LKANPQHLFLVQDFPNKFSDRTIRAFVQWRLSKYARPGVQQGKGFIMQAKPVKDSTITIVYQMTHQDANLAGNVHGGVILKDIDNTAGIVASRHGNTNAVTASIDRVDFYSPVYVGDLLRLLASVNYTGRTSMEVGVRVEAENFMTGEVRHTASAYLSFVALDADGKPTQVPQIILETADEKRRNQEARSRRESRLRDAKEEKDK